MTHDDAIEAAEALVEKLAGNARSGPRKSFAEDRTKLRRKDAQLIKRALLTDGLDFKRLDALAADRDKAHRKLAKDAIRQALAESEAAARRLHALTPESVAPADPQDMVLDQVLFVRSFLNTGTISDSGTFPGQNWAQYRFWSGQDHGSSDIRDWEHGRLSFFTLWQNKKNRTVFVSAAARLMVNAHLSVSAEGTGIASWLGFAPFSHATVKARTTLFAMGASGGSAVGDVVVLGTAKADAGFLSDSDSESIQFNDVLPAPAIAVPKQAFVLIEVELLIDHSGGEPIDFDAESGAFRIDQPTITLTLTT